MRFFVLLFFAAFLSSSLSAQSGKFWADLERSAVPQEVVAKRTLIPNKYRTIKFDFNNLQQFLAKSPMEVEGRKHVEGQLLSLPYPDGRDMEFLMVESPNMMAGISARYPSIKSYYGYNPEEPFRKARIVVSPIGIHVTCTGPEGQVYMDPYFTTEKEYVQSYFVKDHIPADGQFLGCGTKTDDVMEELVYGDEEVTEAELKVAGELVIEKKYRVAIAATGEWTSSYYQGNLENGLAGMNVSVARINSIWERDLAIRIILIDKEDQIIFTSPGTDPYIQANNGGALLGQNTNVLNSNINVGDYDFGHVYTAGCTDVGGVANLGVICGPNKGGGVTCHSSGNIDFITAGTVCHEMGHQFTATHTFNNCGGVEINQNISFGTAFEPGSGSTILSYNGCGGFPTAIPGGRLDFYHSGSLFQIYQFVENGTAGNCAQKIESDNNKPVINFPYEDGFYVPISTPMFLKVDASDEDNDPMRFSFEQYDLGPISDPGQPSGNAPLFRVYNPNDEPFRYLPKKETVIGNNTDIYETLPTYSRDITFRAVVRDYNTTIGYAAWDEVAFHATDEAGPFLVMNPDLPQDIEAGSSFEVQWDVANTDGELVDCQFVNILLSTDGGFNFNTTLVSNVPNDGQHTVVIPDITTNLARIKIEAANNIFYDISDGNSKIVAPSAPAYNFTAAPFYHQFCLPAASSIDISTLSILDYDSPISFQVLGLPDNAVANVSSNSDNPGDPVTIDFDLSAVDITGYFEVEILAISEAGDSMSQMVEFDMYSNNFSELALSTPLQNAVGLSETPDFSWETSVNANSYTIQIATNPSFAPETILQSFSGLVEPTFSPTILLGKNIPIYWRVAPTNICGQGPWTPINVFHTETLSCDAVDEGPINLIIPITQTTIEHTVTFFDDGTINDFNISNIDIVYSPVTYLKLTLTGPDGDEVLLMENICGGTSAVNIGFDNEAPTDIPCPASDGFPHKPMGDLSVYNGKNVKGDWVFKLTTSGNAFDPGKLRNVSLEVCSNVSQSGPQLINNVLLPVRTNDAQTIEPSYLLCEDANNSAGEITYTLVEGLNSGHLTITGQRVEIGQQFSQININQLRFLYNHDGDDATEDEFYFTVTDGEGGFIGKTRFVIDINPNNPVLGVNDLELKALAIFPNPANHSITIDFPEAIDQESRVVVTDIQGRQLAVEQLTKGSRQLIMTTADLAPGVYFIQWANQTGLIANEKLIIQR